MDLKLRPGQSTFKPDRPWRAFRRLCYRVFWWPFCRRLGHDWHYHYPYEPVSFEGGQLSVCAGRWCVRCKKREPLKPSPGMAGVPLVREGRTTKRG